MQNHKRLSLPALAFAVVLGFLTIAAQPSAAGTENIPYIFCPAGGFCADGGLPESPLVFDSAGNLYGTTTIGGVNNGIGGVVFQMTPNGSGGWNYNVIYNFCSVNSPVRCADGAVPQDGLIVDAAGNLYGTTSYGGVGKNCPYQTPCGVVFELSHTGGSQWTEKVLYSFNADGKDGMEPWGGLAFDTSGNLYGTTLSGGIHGKGAIFRLTFGQNGTWTEKVLFSFAGTNGSSPYGGVAFDNKGNMYGTAGLGGLKGVSCYYGVGQCGTVFRLAPGTNGTWRFTMLHAFKHTDGDAPPAGVVVDASGNLYGTTQAGGTNNLGTVFEMVAGTNNTFKLKTLANFTGTGPNFPAAPVTLDAAGDLFGTSLGGSFGVGDVYKLTPGSKGTWTLGEVYVFGNNSGDGLATPLAGVVLDSSGNLYGTTVFGGPGFQCGNSGCGTVFEVTP